MTGVLQYIPLHYNNISQETGIWDLITQIWKRSKQNMLLKGELAECCCVSYL